MINAIDLLFAKGQAKVLIQLSRRPEITAERFFDDDTWPGCPTFLRPRQTGSVEMVHDIVVGLWRGGEIINGMVLRLVPLADLAQNLMQATISHGVVKR